MIAQESHYSDMPGSLPFSEVRIMREYNNATIHSNITIVDIERMVKKSGKHQRTNRLKVMLDA